MINYAISTNSKNTNLTTKSHFKIRKQSVQGSFQGKSEEIYSLVERLLSNRAIDNSNLGDEKYDTETLTKLTEYINRNDFNYDDIMHLNNAVILIDAFVNRAPENQLQRSYIYDEIESLRTTGNFTDKSPLNDISLEGARNRLADRFNELKDVGEFSENERILLAPEYNKFSLVQPTDMNGAELGQINADHDIDRIVQREVINAIPNFIDSGREISDLNEEELNSLKNSVIDHVKDRLEAQNINIGNELDKLEINFEKSRKIPVVEGLGSGDYARQYSSEEIQAINQINEMINGDPTEKDNTKLSYIAGKDSYVFEEGRRGNPDSYIKAENEPLIKLDDKFEAKNFGNTLSFDISNGNNARSVKTTEQSLNELYGFNDYVEDDIFSVSGTTDDRYSLEESNLTRVPFYESDDFTVDYSFNFKDAEERMHLLSDIITGNEEVRDSDKLTKEQANLENAKIIIGKFKSNNSMGQDAFSLLSEIANNQVEGYEDFIQEIGGKEVLSDWIAGNVSDQDIYNEIQGYIGNKEQEVENLKSKPVSSGAARDELSTYLGVNKEELEALEESIGISTTNSNEKNAELMKELSSRYIQKYQEHFTQSLQERFTEQTGLPAIDDVYETMQNSYESEMSFKQSDIELAEGKVLHKYKDGIESDIHDAQSKLLVDYINSLSENDQKALLNEFSNDARIPTSAGDASLVQKNTFSATNNGREFENIEDLIKYIEEQPKISDDFALYFSDKTFKTQNEAGKETSRAVYSELRKIREENISPYLESGVYEDMKYEAEIRRDAEAEYDNMYKEFLVDAKEQQLTPAQITKYNSVVNNIEYGKKKLDVQGIESYEKGVVVRLNIDGEGAIKFGVTDEQIKQTKPSTAIEREALNIDEAREEAVEALKEENGITKTEEKAEKTAKGTKIADKSDNSANPEPKTDYVAKPGARNDTVNPEDEARGDKTKKDTSNDESLKNHEMKAEPIVPNPDSGKDPNKVKSYNYEQIENYLDERDINDATTLNPDIERILVDFIKEDAKLNSATAKEQQKIEGLIEEYLLGDNNEINLGYLAREGNKTRFKLGVEEGVVNANVKENDTFKTLEDIDAATLKNALTNDGSMEEDLETGNLKPSSAEGAKTTSPAKGKQ